ncbi:MAG: hypothetical protein LAT68_12465 [Cyclobacteriaceae bacterium]|nr:hypothetical protein [Cyclobacteriaceae bacterium]MCH8517131.1 hypothetical protein [Cyclobacteriaceae bacterium]
MDHLAKLILFLSAIAYSSTTCFGQARTGSPIVTNYSSQENFNLTQNWWIDESDNGLIYVGNNDGLIRFDGSSWNQILPKEIGAVRSLGVQNATGKVFLGQVGDLGYFQHLDSSENYVSLLDKIPPRHRSFDQIWEIVISSNNKTVFFISDYKVFIFDGSDIHVIEDASGNSLHKMHQVGEQVVLKINGRGLARVTEDYQLKLLKGTEQFAQEDVMGIIPKNDSEWLLISRSGVIYNYNYKKETIPSLISTQYQNYLQSNYPYHCTVISKDRFAVGTRIGGVIISDLEGNLIELIDEENSLPEGNIRFVFSDSNANIWLGLNRGIVKVDLAFPVRSWDAKNDISGTTINMVFHEGLLFLSTSTGVFYKEGNDFIKIPGIDDQCWGFSSISKDDENPIVLVSTNLGVYRVSKDTTYRVSSIRTYATDLIPSIEKPNATLVAANEYLLSIDYLGNGKFSDADTLYRFKDKIWRLGYADSTLWISQQKPGLYSYLNGKGFNHSDSLSKLQKENFQLFDFNDQISLSIAGSLITYHPKSQQWQPIRVAQAIGQEGLKFEGIIKNKAGKVFVTAKDDKHSFIFILKENKEKYFEVLCRYSLPLTTFGQLVLSPTDELWYVTNEGISHLQTQNNFENPKINKPIFKSIAFGQSKKYNLFFGTKKNGGVIPYSDNNLTAELVSPNYGRLSNLLASFKLDGLDNQWTKYSQQYVRDYTNLREGNYILQAKIKDPFGNEYFSETFEFQIESPIYRKWYAFLLYIGLSLLLIYIIVKSYNKRLHKQNLRLEDTIESRTIALKNQKEEIERQKKAIEDKNKELQKYLEELDQKKQQLEKLNDTKDKFFSIIAHDLKGPLNSLIGFSELLFKDGSLTNDEIQALAKDLNKSLQNTVELTDNLLTWARLQMDRMDFSPQSITLEELLRPTLKTLVTVAKNKDIEITSSFSPSEKVYADVDQIRFVIRNLISNSIKFTKSGGKVEVIITKNNSNDMVFKVIDQGIGVDQSEINHLFSLEKKTSRVGTKGEKGTGLGLILSKDFVVQNGGEIRVKSERGNGSEFSFHIPTQPKG